ncbi:MAG: GTPase HflX [Eubacteriales bacterium]
MLGEKQDEQELERVIVVGLNVNHQKDFDQSMEELIELVKACDMEVVARVDQNLSTMVQSLYIGKGKVQEIKELIEVLEADIIVFDDALSPMQIRNLQKSLEVPILDRTSLILEIFSKRAKTREAKIQVEVARLQYLLPRLVGLHASLGRQGGGSGVHNKGTGEKKIDLDRKRIQQRINELEKELKQIEKDRRTQRKKRVTSGIKRVALVGYTNVGKSTLMNCFLGGEEKDNARNVLVKDMLFATLDTTVRTVQTPNNREFLLSDTVGFVSKLPHNLVKAFHATLEEVQEADLLLHVADYSQDEVEEQVRITNETLQMLQANQIPVIYVYNKAESKMFHLPRVQDNRIYLSAKEGIGLMELMELIEEALFGGEEEMKLCIPYVEGRLVSMLNEQATVLETTYEEMGIIMRIRCNERIGNKCREYIVGRS